jgi:hypothetical protein
MITKEELTTIALSELALGASKNVKGMEGFGAFWFQKLTPKQQRLVRRYEKAKNEAIDQFVEMHDAEELKRKGGQ